MASTLENINSNILSKISELRKILDMYMFCEFPPKIIISIKKISSDLDDVENTYEIGSISTLTDYYKQQDVESKDAHYRTFMNFILSENILNRLKNLFDLCKNIQRKFVIQSDEIKHAFHAYEILPVTLKSGDVSNNICSCGEPYSIESKTSEYICKECGNTEKLYGVVFEDEQFFYQEGQRTKHGKYDPTKHCDIWIDRIQAKENVSIPVKVINGIKRCIKRDSIYLSDLNCPMIRQYLKALKYTMYNNHVPHILYMITGQMPEQLTDSELQLLRFYFSLTIQIYNRIKPDNKLNCLYYPFFIYKIIEQLLKDVSHVYRRRNILSCIHLQARDTLIESDNTWKMICSEIPEFDYIPTENV